MARPADPHGAEEILRIVGQQPDGVTIEQIAQLVNVPRRTLQRRLAELVTSGRARAIGRGKQRRYQLGREEGARPDELRVSRSGQQVRSLVRRPLIQRTPVGYVASFLDGYRPNHDFYLDTRLRARLDGLGRAPGAERPAGTYARQILGRLLVDLSWASSRLEGNTYTRLDTVNLIQYGRRAPGKDQREAQMILNHKAAMEMLVRALAAPLVAPDDLDDFIAMAISELSGLHEGNLARYRLRPSEFHRWRGRRREPPSS